MTTFKFGMKSKFRLRNVHWVLREIMEDSLKESPLDFGVSCGGRTWKNQQIQVESGASKTMNSRHLLRWPDAPEPILSGPEKKVSHAVDIVVYVGGKVTWAWPPYVKVSGIVKSVAARRDVIITWGGDWPTLQDGPHYELPWSDFPVKEIDQ